MANLLSLRSFGRGGSNAPGRQYSFRPPPLPSGRDTQQIISDKLTQQRITPGVLGASQGGQGFTPDADWAKAFSNGPSADRARAAQAMQQVGNPNSKTMQGPPSPKQTDAQIANAQTPAGVPFRGSTPAEIADFNKGAAPSAGPQWQADVLKNHPEIGVKGTDGNNAFVAAYKDALNKQGAGNFDPAKLADDTMAPIYMSRDPNLANVGAEENKMASDANKIASSGAEPKATAAPASPPAPQPAPEPNFTPYGLPTDTGVKNALQFVANHFSPWAQPPAPESFDGKDTDSSGGGGSFEDGDSSASAASPTGAQTGGAASLPNQTPPGSNLGMGDRQVADNSPPSTETPSASADTSEAPSPAPESNNATGHPNYGRKRSYSFPTANYAAGAPQFGGLGISAPTPPVGMTPVSVGGLATGAGNFARGYLPPGVRSRVPNMASGAPTGQATSGANTWAQANLASNERAGENAWAGDMKSGMNAANADNASAANEERGNLQHSGFGDTTVSTPQVGASALNRADGSTLTMNGAGQTMAPRSEFTPGYARGSRMPNYSFGERAAIERERRAIAKGVGGAKPGVDKVKVVDLRGLGRAVINSGERVVRRANGQDAVLTRAMRARAGRARQKRR